MGLLDLALAPLRTALGVAEREAEVPIHDIEHIEAHALDTAQALREATKSLESHIAVIETLANSIAPLTESVDRLTAQLGEINGVLEPLGGAEREVSRMEHLFGRRRHPAAPAPEATQPPPPPDAT